MKKMFCALMTLCFITVLALPQNANASIPDNEICFASDIGTHVNAATIIITENADADVLTFTNTDADVTAWAAHEAEIPNTRLRTAPPISKRSKYINTNSACNQCADADKNCRWQYRQSKQPNC